MDMSGYKKAAHVHEALTRARDLLEATYRFIGANNLEHKTIFYDEAECDGYCLMSDSKIAIEDSDCALAKADGKDPDQNIRENLVMLVRRMAYRLDRHKEHVDDAILAKQAVTYLNAIGEGGILRGDGGLKTSQR